MIRVNLTATDLLSDGFAAAAVGAAERAFPVLAAGAGRGAIFRFTRGATGAGLVLPLSLVLWLVVPTALAIHRLRRADV